MLFLKLWSVPLAPDPRKRICVKSPKFLGINNAQKCFEMSWKCFRGHYSFSLKGQFLRRESSVIFNRYFKKGGTLETCCYQKKKILALEWGKMPMKTNSEITFYYIHSWRCFYVFIFINFQCILLPSHPASTGEIASKALLSLNLKEPVCL